MWGLKSSWIAFIRILFIYMMSPHVVYGMLMHQTEPCSQIAEGQNIISRKSMLDQEMSYYRLPTSNKPVHQLVRLQPFINGNSSINGYTEITFEVLEASSNITLHMVDIITLNDTIKLLPIGDPEETGMLITNNSYDPDRQFYIATLSEDLQPGNSYVLSMQFTGFLNEFLTGFYRSFYTDQNGNIDQFGVSQFAATYARYAFPCFDEPAMKSKFTIELARETTLNAISNLPKIETTPIDGQPGWFLDIFDTSVPMSSYLVAFLISDLVNMTSSTSDGRVQFGVWSKETALQQTSYALQIGPQILTYYENLFGISYPLPKQDMAAVPDFYYGAMENWGLIIYRETRMLYDSLISSVTDHQGVCSVIAHELAHQWFGNLVTLDWWDDVWLNEGFATFIEYLGCDSVQPDFQIKDQFIINDLQRAFRVDALESSHPVHNTINSPGQIGQIYDTIAYSKGASIIRMMSYFLTEGTFHQGINTYLSKFSYDNVNQDDLWDCLTEQGHSDGTLDDSVSVKEIMDTWTLQMGYPVLHVRRNEDGTAVLTQERFLLMKNENSTDTHNYIWWIPLTYTSQDNPDFSQTTVMEWMNKKEQEKFMSGFPNKNRWVIFNVQQNAFYRVNYDLENWNALILQFRLNNSVISPLNRAQILDDGYTLAKAGMLSYDTILSINAYLSDEDEYVPLYTALNQLDYLDNMLQMTSGYGSFKGYMTDAVIPLYERVGFNDSLNDPHQLQLQRTLIVSWACHLGYNSCVMSSDTLYHQWMAFPSNSSIISPNLKSTVYCTAIGDGDLAEWDFAYAQFLNTNIPSERDSLIYGMGCSSVIWILQRYMDMAFSESSGLRKQDVNKVFSSISQNIYGNQLAWDYVRQESDNIASYMGSYQSVADLANTISENFNTQEELYELEVFKYQLEADLGSATQTLDQSIERTKNNIDWMNKYYAVIISWLTDNGYGNQFIFPLKTNGKFEV